MAFRVSGKYPAGFLGLLLVAFPDFPEAATDARSRDAASAEAIDCLEEAVAGRIKRGEDIPPPPPPAAGAVLVALPAIYSMKAALYFALREARLSQRAFAAKLGKNEEDIRRLLDPEHASRMSALEAALRSIGKRAHTVVSDVR
jgi:antitoxin HicB